ncbi:MAG: histidine phosphatase family protein [Labilithrix sp.]|nr:histidine phosphatase family protein [Labilithrix sp.]MCW5834667.1 histidine phosphatase family protein [Labilithrix sp.]
MKLYVMRHGPAEDTSPTGRDGDRALTPEGRERTRAVARALVAEGEAPLTIIASPLVRALQTAEIVAAVTDLEKRVREAKDAGGAPGAVEIRREMAPGGDTLGLVLELARAGRKRAMVVGHEPDLSMLVSRLIDRQPEPGMLKSMVVGAKVEPAATEAPKDAPAGKRLGQASAAFRFVLDPKSLHWQRD